MMSTVISRKRSGSRMFEKLINQLIKLDRLRIQIVAEGEYPNKNRTEVAHVSYYQNDGTERITPAKFVSKAESKHNSWERQVWQAIEKYMDGDDTAMMDLGMKISVDISTEVKRIKTGRLKKSFRPVQVHR